MSGNPYHDERGRFTSGASKVGKAYLGYKTDQAKAVGKFAKTHHKVIIETALAAGLGLYSGGATLAAKAVASHLGGHLASKKFDSQLAYSGGSIVGAKAFDVALGLHTHREALKSFIKRQHKG